MNSTSHVASLKTTKTVEIAQMLTSRIGKKRLLLSLAATMACLQAATAATDNSPSYGRKAHRVLAERDATNATQERLGRRLGTGNDATRGLPGLNFPSGPMPSKLNANEDNAFIHGTVGARNVTDINDQVTAYQRGLGSTVKSTKDPNAKCAKCGTKGGNGFIRWNGTNWVGITYEQFKNNTWADGSPVERRENKIVRTFKKAIGSNAAQGLVDKFRKEENKKYPNVKHNYGESMMCPDCGAGLDREQKLLLGGAITSLVAGVGLCGIQMGESIQNYVGEEGKTDLVLELNFILALVLGVVAIACIGVFVLNTRGGCGWNAVTGGSTLIGLSAVTAMTGMVLSTQLEGFKFVDPDGTSAVSGQGDKVATYCVMGAAAVFLLIGMILVAVHLRTKVGWSSGRVVASVIGVCGIVGIAASTGLLVQEGIDDVNEKFAEAPGAEAWKVALFWVGALLAVCCIWYMIMGSSKKDLVSYSGLVLLGGGAVSLSIGITNLTDYAVINEGSTNADDVGEYLISDHGFFILIAAGLLLLGLLATAYSKCKAKGANWE